MKKIIISLTVATILLHSQEYKINNGWNLLGAVDDIANFSDFKSKGNIIWTYNNGYKAINFDNDKIIKGSGFWFMANSSTIINTNPQIDSNKTDLNIRYFNLPDTGEIECFNSNGLAINCINAGQDGSYIKNSPNFTKNNDKTVTDNITGLIWQGSPDIDNNGIINANDKLTQSEAVSYCSNLNLAGYSDWRLPDIKTLYSLINFNGEDISGYDGTSTSGLKPFIDTNIFVAGYGDISVGERLIDAQWATTTLYVSTTMNGNKTMFGVNFADGRIKGYGISSTPNGEKKFYVQCVRGNENYGINKFSEIKNTIIDSATNLMWQKSDSKKAMDWNSAISYCENLTLNDYQNWRLPNTKELESIVDYKRSPDTTNSPAIDSLFESTEIINEAGKKDYGYYWTSTTHKTYNAENNTGVYISFGRAMGYMNGSFLDVHGAGTQRSDPKISILNNTLDNSYQKIKDFNANTTLIHGPQGDVLRSLNYARCVRDLN